MSEIKKHKKTNYQIGDILLALKTFHLTKWDTFNNENKDYYYGVGDKFILMKVEYYNDTCVQFSFNTHKETHSWSLEYVPNENYDELAEFQEYLIHKKDFERAIRLKKLKQLNENL